MRNFALTLLFTLLTSMFSTFAVADSMSTVLVENKKQSLITLQVTNKVIIPVGNGNAKIEIINNTMEDALYVEAILPEAWSGVIQNSQDCLVLPANGGKCNLILSSEQPYAPQQILIKGENTDDIKQPVAFSLNDYLVFNVDHEKRQAKVIYNQRTKKSKLLYTFWNEGFPIGASSRVDGMENTTKIYHVYKKDKSWNLDRKRNPGAVVHCAKLKDSGGYWYLPAIGQMQIINRLVQFDFMPGGKYWTSTEVLIGRRHVSQFFYMKLEKNMTTSSEFLSAKSKKHNSICAKHIAY